MTHRLPLKQQPKERYSGWTKSCTTLKPWDTVACWYLFGESSFQGFLGGAGFRPSTVSYLWSHSGRAPRVERSSGPFSGKACDPSVGGVLTNMTCALKTQRPEGVPSTCHDRTMTVLGSESWCTNKVTHTHSLRKNNSSQTWIREFQAELS